MPANKFAGAKKLFIAALKQLLTRAGYPPTANVHAINAPRALALLLVFMTAAAALYGPQAAALVELFPTASAIRRSRSPITSASAGSADFCP